MARFFQIKIHRPYYRFSRMRVRVAEMFSTVTGTCFIADRCSILQLYRPVFARYFHEPHEQVSDLRENGRFSTLISFTVYTALCMGWSAATQRQAITQLLHGFTPCRIRRGS